MPGVVGLSEPVARHGFSAGHMQLIIFMLFSAVSLRGSSRVMEIFFNFLRLPIAVPSWYTCRLWLLKLGYYKLSRPKEKADDWIWIADHSVQWGSEKCLVILGIRAKDLPKDRALAFSDVEPIELLPVTTSNGVIVHQQLIAAVSKTGVPRAIVSDGGSDLKLGIDKFRLSNKHTIHIYDIKHKIALLLKVILEADPNWLSFIEYAATAQKYMRQTEVAALAPPNQRSKSRYMNIDILVNWAEKVLEKIDSPLCNTLFDKEKVSITLSWINYFEEDIAGWSKLVKTAKIFETFISKHGIYKGVTDDLKRELTPLTISIDSLELQENLLRHVFYSECQLQIQERLLGSSEIIESLFGKFKNIEKDQASSGFTNLLLALPAMVAECSCDGIKKAMESVKVKEVWNWFAEHVGQSVQSKRKAIFCDDKRSKSGITLEGTVS